MGSRPPGSPEELCAEAVWLSCRCSVLIGCMSFGVKSLLSLDKVALMEQGLGLGSQLAGCVWGSPGAGSGFSLCGTEML